MGGNAKHMPHVWENYDATFSDVFSLLENLTVGSIDATEKFDGANIYFRVDRNGVCKFSRNGTQLATGGFTFQEALKLYQNHQAGDLFIEGCRAIDETFTGVWWPFGYSGRDWINAEIIFTENPQLLNYSDNAIVLHGVSTRTPDGKSFFDEKKQEKLPRLLESASPEVTTLTNRHWKTFGPCGINLPDESGSGYLSEAKNRIRQCMKYAGLIESNTLRDFLNVSLRQGPLDKIRTSSLIKDKLADKISGVDGSIRLVDLKRNQPAGVAAEISFYGQRKNEDKHCKAAMKPIINTLDAFAASRLSNLKSTLITDAAAERDRIMLEISVEGERVLTQKDEYFEKRREMFDSLLEDWNKISSVPAAIEGLTFDFCGRRTKITGGFATLNQLLGLNRYGRGQIPALNTEENRTQSLVEYFGLL